jgi:hypothetical protein
MYKVHLFQFKSQFNSIFNVTPVNQGSPIFFCILLSNIVIEIKILLMDQILDHCVDGWVVQCIIRRVDSYVDGQIGRQT